MGIFIPLIPDFFPSPSTELLQFYSRDLQVLPAWHATPHSLHSTGSFHPRFREKLKSWLFTERSLSTQLKCPSLVSYRNCHHHKPSLNLMMCHFCFLHVCLATGSMGISVNSCVKHNRGRHLVPWLNCHWVHPHSIRECVCSTALSCIPAPANAHPGGQQVMIQAAASLLPTVGDLD